MRLRDCTGAESPQSRQHIFQHCRNTSWGPGHEVRTINLKAVAMKSHSCVFVDLTSDPPLTRLAFLDDQVSASATECLKRLEQKVAELAGRIDQRERWLDEGALVCQFALL